MNRTGAAEAGGSHSPRRPGAESRQLDVLWVDVRNRKAQFRPNPTSAPGMKRLVSSCSQLTNRYLVLGPC